jgi:outer membrane receptor for ferrienterochelin and colicins
MRLPPRPRRWALLAAWPCLAHVAAAQPAATRVAGRVTEAETGRPIAGAEVVLLGSVPVAVRSDSTGAWRLDAPSQAGIRLRVRHPGHAYRDVTVSPEGAARVDVELDRLALALDAIVVTASRREQRLAEVAVETAVLDAAALRRSGAPDLAAVLAEQSGLQLDGGTPAGAGIQMRGFDSRRVLVLLDGQPLVGRVDGNFDLSRLPVSMVERVEVVKGPQSTLYGSEALGGVINIITQRAESPGWSAGLTTGAGTQGRLEAAGDLQWRRGDVGVTLDGGARTIDLAPGITGSSGTFARRGNGMATVAWDLAPRTRATGSVLAVRESQRYRTGQLFRFADNTQWAARTALERQTVAGRLSGSLHATAFDHLSRASTLDAPVSGDGDRDRQTLVQAEALWNAAVGRVAIDAGTQLRREAIVADRVLDRRRHVASAEPFVQLTASSRTASVVPGVRVSWSDRWGRFVAPRLAAMWRPVEPVALRASVGRGFRAPDFKELYLDFVNPAAGYAVVGNEALRPERSTTTSLSLEYTGRVVWGRAGVFRNAYRDFIETSEPDAGGTYTYLNLDRGSMRGLELESGLSAGAWRADASADFLHTRDASTGTPLLGRPRHTVRASLTAPVVAQLRGTASLVYTGRTPIDRDPSGTSVLERGGWSRLDLRAMLPLPSGLTWSVGVQNVFDRQMGAAWPGFTGRQVTTSLEWRAGPATR